MEVMEFVRYDSMIRAHVLDKQMCTDGKQRWVAFFPDFPKCSAQGDTDVEAVQRLYELYPRYREAMKALGVSDQGLKTGMKPASSAMTFQRTVPTLSTSTGEPWPNKPVPA